MACHSSVSLSAELDEYFSLCYFTFLASSLDTKLHKLLKENRLCTIGKLDANRRTGKSENLTTEEIP